MSQQSQLDAFKTNLESLRDDATGGFGFAQKRAVLQKMQQSCNDIARTIADRDLALAAFPGATITNAQLLAKINPIIANANVLASEA